MVLKLLSLQQGYESAGITTVGGKHHFRFRNHHRPSNSTNVAAIYGCDSKDVSIPGVTPIQGGISNSWRVIGENGVRPVKRKRFVGPELNLKFCLGCTRWDQYIRSGDHGLGSLPFSNDEFLWSNLLVFVFFATNIQAQKDHYREQKDLFHNDKKVKMKRNEWKIDEAWIKNWVIEESLSSLHEQCEIPGLVFLSAAKNQNPYLAGL
jgi:hypothetical protein